MLAAERRGCDSLRGFQRRRWRGTELRAAVRRNACDRLCEEKAAECSSPPRQMFTERRWCGRVRDRVSGFFFRRYHRVRRETRRDKPYILIPRLEERLCWLFGSSRSF